jgi:hypothetical protein
MTRVADCTSCFCSIGKVPETSPLNARIKRVKRSRAYRYSPGKFLRAKGQEYCIWIPGEGAALRKINQLALEFDAYDAVYAVSPSK